MTKIAGIGIAAPPKEWAWSYSKLKNFEVCPKRHYEVDILKNFDDGTDNEHIAEGNRVHKVLADACSNGTALAPHDAHLQKWVDMVRGGPGILMVEQKFAITRDFRPTGYFARDVWFRGIGDIVRIDGSVALVLDWKTGKVVEDSVQLALTAQCIFSHYPLVKGVRTEFVWLKEDCTSPEVFKRDDSVRMEAETLAEHWSGLLPRINKLEQAHKTMTYPPKPNNFCRKWCPVNSCPHHGKGKF